MSACRRFEEEALERIERGLPLDSHFENCPDCLRERESYGRLRRALQQDPGEITPPAGWRDAVWQFVDAESGVKRAPSSKPRRRWWTRPALAAAALLLLALLVRIPLRGPVETELVVRTEAGGEVVRRNTEVQVGDEIIVRATVESGRAARLRIYRNEEELLLDCSDAPPCGRAAERLEATYRIGERGEYEIALIVCAGEIPPATGVLDTDIGAATRAGCEYRISKRISAR